MSPLWRSRSLVVRITCLFALIVCVVVSMVGGSLYHATSATLSTRADYQLIGRVEHFRSLLHDLYTIKEIEAVRARMGWRFNWVSSYHNDFNYDFNVSFTPAQLANGTALYNFAPTNPGIEDLSGDSVFYKDDSGKIFHTYSTYGRGGEQFLGIYGFFDVMPKGRNETGPYHSLTDWARPRNMYAGSGIVEGNGRYHASACACSIHK